MPRRGILPRSQYCLAFAVQALAWSLTGHPQCSGAKLRMIIPGCYSRVSWVLSSELRRLSEPGEDPYRCRLPVRRDDSSATAVHRFTSCSPATLEVVPAARRWGIAAGWPRPRLLWRIRVMETRATCPVKTRHSMRRTNFVAGRNQCGADRSRRRRQPGRRRRQPALGWRGLWVGRCSPGPGLRSWLGLWVCAVPSGPGLSGWPGLWVQAVPSRPGRAAGRGLSGQIASPRPRSRCLSRPSARAGPFPGPNRAPAGVAVSTRSGCRAT